MVEVGVTQGLLVEMRERVAEVVVEVEVVEVVATEEVAVVAVEKMVVAVVAVGILYSLHTN